MYYVPSKPDLFFFFFPPSETETETETEGARSNGSTHVHTLVAFFLWRQAVPGWVHGPQWKPRLSVLFDGGPGLANI